MRDGRTVLDRLSGNTAAKSVRADLEALLNAVPRPAAGPEDPNAPPDALPHFGLAAGPPATAGARIVAAVRAWEPRLRDARCEPEGGAYVLRATGPAGPVVLRLREVPPAGRWAVSEGA